MTNKWSFSYDSFVKLSQNDLLNTQSIAMDSKHRIIKRLHYMQLNFLQQVKDKFLHMDFIN